MNNLMKIPLSNAFDTHWVYVHRYMGSSVNIIVRAHVDSRFHAHEIDNAIADLVAKHPYLVAKVCEEERNSHAEFYLETIDNQALSAHYNEVKCGDIASILAGCSERRNYRFNIEMGELAHMEVWQDDSTTLIELSCAHLLTDVTGMLLLMSDFLKCLDTRKSSISLKADQCRRLPFDEVRYKWVEACKEPAPIPLPKVLSPNAEEWPDVHFEYCRQKFSSKKFSSIKSYLNGRGISAKVADFFYYILTLIYAREYGGGIQTNVILSFRHLLRDEIDVNNINTLAVFAHVDMSDQDLDDPASWMEYFYSVRDKAIDPENIIEFMYFFRCLNLTMPGDNVTKGRQILNTLLPVNSNDAVFAFNNYGIIDPFFEELSSFNLMDIDVQDGVLAQEVRMFSFRDKIHFNMMFSPQTLPFSVEEFWIKLNHYIDEALGSD